ncbi:unnamed protein product [Rhizoctonia solani]|uniref:N-acetyltransferase domain-containing protein n=1 Tax=Rhizoctonia solani TaxID=456999 RepID=A0A8H3DKK4_9AGAM|nr:unnamed protein product [Rhizoctonia solani]
MNDKLALPEGFDLELLESQGGGISPDDFSKLVSQLEQCGSFNYAGRQALGATLDELDIVYVILRKGFIYEPANSPIQYTHVLKDYEDYWLAGFGCLRAGQAASGGEGTAEILISLLPRAQRVGCGRFLVQKLVEYAFDTFHGSIHRITAPIICPVRPHYTAAQKKQVVSNTKQLCWMFEKFGFTFEGVTRGAVESFTDGKSVWHDAYRMSMLHTDYLEEGRSYFLSNTRAFPNLAAKTSPWESMMQRQDEEKRDLESWAEKPVQPALADDACDEGAQNDDESDDDTVLGGDDDGDWELPDDFED